MVVSRYAKLKPQIKSVAEKLGFTNVMVTEKDLDGLNFVINEMKPRLVIICSGFYKAATPYMMGRLLKDFPKLRIVAVTVGDYSDEIAMGFKWHGVKSYINLLEGFDEFLKGIEAVKRGEEYIAPTVQWLHENCTEWPDGNVDIAKRQKEVLVHACNGFDTAEIGRQMGICKRTVEDHFNELHKILGTSNRGELIRNAFYLELVTKEDLCFYRMVKQPFPLPEWMARKQKVAKLQLAMSS